MKLPDPRPWALGAALWGALAAGPLQGAEGAAPSPPHPVVLGYSAYWFDDLYPPEAYNYGALTHIARAFLLPLPDGSLQVAASYFDPVLKKEAQAHGVKLLASVGGGAWNSDNWLAMARNGKARRHFFDELDRLLTANGFDGVDIDWEPGPLTDQDQATFTGFMKALRRRFPHWILTTALAPGDYFAKHVSWKELASCVDFFNIMTYDFGGPWVGHTSFAANLHPSDDPKRNSGLSLEEAAALLEGKYGVAPSQMLMGLPFYGQAFFSKGLGDDYPKTFPTDTSLEYYEIAPLEKDPNYERHWDGAAQEPFLIKQKGTGVFSYDDARATAAKCRFVQDKKLGGVMIWDLGADVTGDRTPLLDAAADAFGAGRKGIPPKTLPRIVRAFGQMVRGAWDNLLALHQKLDAAGQDAAAQETDPGAEPEPPLALDGDPRALPAALERLQARLTDLEQRTFEAQMAMAPLPTTRVAGSQPFFNGDRMLLADFETDPGAGLEKWTVETDPYGMGTKAYPQPFSTSPGGCPDSPKAAAHFWGHLGPGRPPGPKALLKCQLMRDGSAVDLSGFKAIEFWAKGDGAFYHLTVGQAAVEDGAYYGADFTAGDRWKKIVIPFSRLTQASGKAVAMDWRDVQFLSFGPVNATGDIDFDLTIDQVALVK
jgi:chitinase